MIYALFRSGANRLLPFSHSTLYFDLLIAINLYTVLKRINSLKHWQQKKTIARLGLPA